jgi:hypothetical protein
MAATAEALAEDAGGSPDVVTDRAGGGDGSPRRFSTQEETMSGFKRATKAAAKLRAAVFGPSGAGKTFTSLRIAKGLGGSIAVIDTEGAFHQRPDGTVEEMSSAAKYADRFEFDVLNLNDKSIDGYIAAIRDAADGGYGVLVIDSLSHGWQTLLEEVEKLAKAKYRGNTWSAWSEGTPLQRKLVQAILSFPGHVIATMRSKTEWTTVDDGKGRKSPQRVGLAPEQGKGVEYEFDLLIEISTDHIGNVIKDRTGKFQDKLIDKPGEDFGRQLADWLNTGEQRPAVPPAAASPPARPAAQAAAPVPLPDQISDYIRGAQNVRTLGKIADRLDELASTDQITREQHEALTARIEARHNEIDSQEVAHG